MTYIYIYICVVRLWKVKQTKYSSFHQQQLHTVWRVR